MLLYLLPYVNICTIDWDLLMCLQLNFFLPTYTRKFLLSLLVSQKRLQPATPMREHKYTVHAVGGK